MVTQKAISNLHRLYRELEGRTGTRPWMEDS